LSQEHILSDKLSKQDVTRLLSDPSVDNRVETARKVAENFRDNSFSGHERDLALEIFKVMVQDATDRVRLALSEHLKDCPHIPHDLAVTLASDVDAVAAPVLRFSEVLTDEDLIEIIIISGEAKQSAIAGRSMVSEVVTDSLIVHGNENVVTRVMENPGAQVSESTFEKAFDRFGDDERIGAAITRRGLMPLSVAERLVAKASESLEKQLSTKVDLSANTMADLIMSIRERATLTLVDPRFGIGDARALVKTLAENDRLTPSIVIRGLCMGDIAFFEAALAHLADLRDTNAMILIHDEGQRGLKALWHKAKMHAAMLPVAAAAVDIASELDYDGEAHDRERYRRRVIERVLTRCDEGQLDLGRLDHESLEYLLAKLGEFQAAETVGVH
jgi:uncharacterized protein (DUF2336 family)